MIVYTCTDCGFRHPSVQGIFMHAKTAHGKNLDRTVIAGTAVEDPGVVAVKNKKGATKLIPIAQSAQIAPAAPVAQSVQYVAQPQQDLRPLLADLKNSIAALGTPSQSASSEELKKVCEGIDCIKTSVEKLTDAVTGGIDELGTGEKTDRQEHDDHAHAHEKADTARAVKWTTEDALKHMVTCKDGSCTTALRQAVVTNWSRLFPGLRMVSSSLAEKYTESLQRETEEAAKKEEPVQEPVEETKPAEEPKKPAATEPTETAPVQEEVKDAPTEAPKETAEEATRERSLFDL